MAVFVSILVLLFIKRTLAHDGMKNVGDIRLGKRFAPNCAFDAGEREKQPTKTSNPNESALHSLLLGVM